LRNIEYAPAAVAIVTSASPTATIVRPALTVMSLLSTLACVSGGNITALSVARTLDGVTFGPARPITTGLPLAAGQSLDIDILDEPSIAYRFRITAASAGTATLTSRGVV